MHMALTQLVRSNRLRLAGMTRQPIFSSPEALLGTFWQRHDEKKQQLELAAKWMFHTLRSKVHAFENRLRGLQPGTNLAHFRQRLGNLHKALQQSYTTGAKEKRRRLRECALLLQQEAKGAVVWKTRLFLSAAPQKRLDALCRQLSTRKRERLHALVAHLNAVDPRSLLKKGYSILFSEKEGSLIISSRQLSPHQKIRAHLSDGQATFEVQEVTCHDSPHPQ